MGNKMVEMNKDPILQALARMEAKQDQLLENQERMDEEIQKIHKECRRVAILSGGLSGGVIALGIEFIRIKLGG